VYVNFLVSNVKETDKYSAETSENLLLSVKETK